MDPKGFKKAGKADRRVFGSEAEQHVKGGPSDAEVKAYKNLVRRYKRHSGKALDYLPDEIRKRVEKKAPDLIPGLREYRKMSAQARQGVFRRISTYLNQKATTKRGYQETVDNRYKAWKKKIPGLTKKEFDTIVKNGLFNDLKQFYDSDAIIDDIAAIVGNANKKDKAVEKYMKQIEKYTKQKNGKKAQEKYNALREKIRTGSREGKGVASFLKSIFNE